MRLWTSLILCVVLVYYTTAGEEEISDLAAAVEILQSTNGGNCGPGYRCVIMIDCLACGYGFYKQGSGLGSCVPCPEDCVTLRQGATNMYECVSKCPKGYESSGVTCIKCRPGHYKSNSDDKACDKCPNDDFDGSLLGMDDETQCYSSSDPEDPVETTTPSDYNSEMTTQPDDSTEMTTPPDDSTEMTTPPDDSTEMTTPPDDSTEMTTPPDDSIEMTTPPDDSTEMTTPPDDSTEMTTPPDDSTEMTTPLDDSTEMTTPLYESTEVTTQPDASTEVTTPPDDSTEMTTPPDASTEVTTPPDASTEVTTPPDDSTDVTTTTEEPTTTSGVPRIHGDLNFTYAGNQSYLETSAGNWYAFLWLEEFFQDAGLVDYISSDTAGEIPVSIAYTGADQLYTASCTFNAAWSYSYLGFPSNLMLRSEEVVSASVSYDLYDNVSTVVNIQPGSIVFWYDYGDLEEPNVCPTDGCTMLGFKLLCGSGYCVCDPVGTWRYFPCPSQTYFDAAAGQCVLNPIVGCPIP